MRQHPRVRKAAKWSGLAACTLIAAVWALSLNWYVRCMSAAGSPYVVRSTVFFIIGGRVEFRRGVTRSLTDDFRGMSTNGWEVEIIRTENLLEQLMLSLKPVFSIDTHKGDDAQFSTEFGLWIPLLII